MPDPINGRPVTPRNTAMAVASSALKAQQSRMRIIAENIANAESTANVAGGQPYRRQTPVFQARNVAGATGVVLAEVRPDQSDFRMDYDPSHPAANAEGYVQRPNVDTLVEAMDMREAQRAYEANLNVIETARNMDSRTLDIIKK
ncbi:flagellar basal body rod protein FlgC [Brevundimonas phoenicis]|uniref:flagellar basal body rod protein FlgC n=1 Tax=unclassified Brevundimonas TaxID=2622653 RepID=UPI0039A24592